VPELPEVETIVRDLGRLVTGARIEEVEVLRPDLIEGEQADRFACSLHGTTIRNVGRRAKNILLRLDDQVLVVNLGMTGRMLVVDAAASEPTHLGVRFRLQDGRRILYQDVRRFGRLQRYATPDWKSREQLFGVEPLSDHFTPEFLHGLASRSRTPIKTWLMDQRRVVGVGNIYASEALFRASIDPRRPAASLTPAEAARLRGAVRDVLLEAINFRGTTLLDYRDASGESGSFATRLRVYDRSGEPCRHCGTPIQRIVQAGRSTFFCAQCQE
jgi:formamidopyrimidine-DNA glycosylase